MPTVQDCIDGLHVSYPQVEDAQALIYFRQVHRDLLANAQIETGEELLDLTAGQREYALDQTDKIVVVRAADYIKSAQDVAKLTPVSTDWLDTYDPTWRTSTQQGRQPSRSSYGVVTTETMSEGSPVRALFSIPCTRYSRCSG